MGECHAWEGKHELALIIDFLGKAISTAYYKDQTPMGYIELMAEEGRKLYWAILLASLVKQDDTIARTHVLQEEGTLLLLDDWRRHALAAFDIGKDGNVKWCVMAYSLGVLLNETIQVFIYGFTDNEKWNFHGCKINAFLQFGWANTCISQFKLYLCTSKTKNIQLIF